MPISSEARDRRRGVVAVQRREQQVAGERGLDAICAVSWSRISPTITTSGSARSIERSPVAKLTPAFTLTCICLTPSIRYSTGSSIVRIERSPVLSLRSAA